jgi:hypothetical protein
VVVYGVLDENFQALSDEQVRLLIENGQFEEVFKNG